MSFTVPANLRSQAVMEKIGMTRSPTDDSTIRPCPPDTRCGGMSSTDAGGADAALPESEFTGITSLER